MPEPTPQQEALTASQAAQQIDWQAYAIPQDVLMTTLDNDMRRALWQDIMTLDTRPNVVFRTMPAVTYGQVADVTEYHTGTTAARIPAVTRSDKLSYNIGTPTADCIKEVAALFEGIPYEGFVSMYDTVFYDGGQYTRYDTVKWVLRLINSGDCQGARWRSIVGALGVTADVMEDCEYATASLLAGCTLGRGVPRRARIRYQTHGQYLTDRGLPTPKWMRDDSTHYSYAPLLGPEAEVVHTAGGALAFRGEDVMAAVRTGSSRCCNPYHTHVVRAINGEEAIRWPWWLIDFDHLLGDAGQNLSPEARRAWLRMRASNNLQARIARWNSDDIRPEYNPKRTDISSAISRTRHAGLNEALMWARSHQKEWDRAYVLEAMSINATLPSRLGHEMDNYRKAKANKLGLKHLEYYARLDWMDRERAGLPHNPDLDRPWDRSRSCRGMPWCNEWWWYAGTNPLELLHRPDVATDPMQLSYWQSADKFHRNVRTTIKPGKYLKKYFGLKSKDALFPVLSDAEIQKWAEAWEREFKPVPVHFKEDNDPDGWTWVYSNETGFESCMSSGKNSGRGPDAVRIFAKEGNGLRLAYTTDTGEPDGMVTARCIVNDKVKSRGRVYGDARLGMTLGPLGYLPKEQQLEGVELALIEYDANHWYLPYIDRGTESGGGSMYVRLNEDKTALICTSEHVDDCQACRYETALIPKRYLDAAHRMKPGDEIIREDDDDEECVPCDVCGEYRHAEEHEHSSFHDEHICPDCIDGYRFAYVGRYEMAWVRSDLVVECDGEDYLDRHDVLSAHDLARCEHDGEVYSIDDLVEVPSGERVHAMYATALDHAHENGHGDTFDWCMDEDAVELHDGTVVFKEDAIEWEDGSLHHVNDPEPEQDDEAAEEQAA